MNDNAPERTPELCTPGDDFSHIPVGSYIIINISTLCYIYYCIRLHNLVLLCDIIYMPSCDRHG